MTTRVTRVTPEQARALVEHPGFRETFRRMAQALNAAWPQIEALMASLRPYRRAEVRRVHQQYRQRHRRR